MTSYKDQWIDEEGINHRPHVSVTMNLTKPTESKPALLTLGEVETFLHRIRTCLTRHIRQYTLRKPQRYECLLGFCGTSVTNYGKFCRRTRFFKYLCPTLPDG